MAPEGPRITVRWCGGFFIMGGDPLRTLSAYGGFYCCCIGAGKDQLFSVPSSIIFSI